MHTVEYMTVNICSFDYIVVLVFSKIASCKYVCTDFAKAKYSLTWANKSILNICFKSSSLKITNMRMHFFNVPVQRPHATGVI